MAMHELVLLAPESLVEPLSDALLEQCGALSVSVEDADAGSEAEQALFGEPGSPVAREGWQRSTLRVHFESHADATAAAATLQAEAWGQGARQVALHSVPDADWVRLTQSQFEPVQITPSFWIVPSWHEPPRAASTLIRLDPGLAFGTGTHPTTRMCLRWIASAAPRQAQPWERVLDYGCGSGILAIGAALHGARAIDAVDIDPAAVRSTLANAQANGVQLNAGLPDAARGGYALVLANILASPLKLLAPVLCSHLAAGASLVLAGILERQADELERAYAPHLRLEVSDQEDGWILMTGQRAG
jgi:ribosomal protein L11 methyltransferase